MVHHTRVDATADEGFILKVTILGAKGQLGSELHSLLGSSNEIQDLGSKDINVTDFDSMVEPISNFRPNWILNTVAYHQIAECETKPEIARLVNTVGAINVAELAAKVGAKTVFFSTDYVFSGDKPSTQSFSEKDQTNPKNIYGLTKRDGELATLEIGETNVVARVASLFGVVGSRGKGGNFVETIVKKLRAGETVSIIDDNLMSPTYAKSAAFLTSRMLEKHFEGMFHLNNSGSVSWYDFALQIEKSIGLKGLVDPRPSTKEEMTLRPKNSSLENSKIANFAVVPSWETALHQYLLEKGHCS